MPPQGHKKGDIVLVEGPGLIAKRPAIVVRTQGNSCTAWVFTAEADSLRGNQVKGIPYETPDSEGWAWTWPPQQVGGGGG